MFPTFFIPSGLTGYALSDPVFWAKLNEASAPYLDYSTDAATITPSGTITANVSAPEALGAAIRFTDGVAGNLTWPTPVRWTGLDFSLEAWFRTTQTDLQTGVGGFYQTFMLIVSDITGQHYDYGMSISSNPTLVNFGVGVEGAVDQATEATQGRVQSASGLNDGNWHHVVGTRNSSTGTLKIYVDGALSNTKTGVHNNAVPGFSAVASGSQVDTANVDVCHLAMYARVLTDAEVLAHYNAGTA
jgi:hypothetical protein